MESIMRLDAANGKVVRNSSFQGELVPSRRGSLETCRQAMRKGPVLVVGGAGTGKSFLLNKLVLQDSKGWIQLDLSPSMGGSELREELARRLGGERGSSLSLLLEEESLEGRRWGLCLDEIHCATAEVLDEIRVLANRLGQDEGFETIVCAGQTSILQRLRTRALAGFWARLAGVVSLGPIEPAEVSFLFEDAATKRHAAPHQARWHREGQGNPGQILRFVARAELTRAKILSAEGVSSSGIEEAALVSTGAISSAIREVEPSQALLPSEPPEQLDEETIEVGWSEDSTRHHDTDEGFGSVEAEEFDVSDDLAASGGAPQESGPDELDVEEGLETEVAGGPLVVDDHYAALQAWNEWTKNQEIAGAGQGGSAAGGRTATPAGAEVGGVGVENGQEGGTRVRAETQHTPVAPRSHLYSRSSPHREGDA